MTTFIDFRYSKSISSALFFSHQVDEAAVVFTPDRDSYFCFEYTDNQVNGKLFDLVTKNGHVMGSVHNKKTGEIIINGEGNKSIIRVLAAPSNKSESIILCMRIGPGTTGLKVGRNVYEKNFSFFVHPEQELYLSEDNAKSPVSILGRGTGRLMRWGELFYHKHEFNPGSLNVEMVFDWHNLRSGLPLNGIMTAEELISQKRFNLMFRSYAYDDKSSRKTDFFRLFNTTAAPDLRFHVAPPLYSRIASDVPNIGLFVCETKSILPGLVERCNMMTSIIAPTKFVSSAFKSSGVHCPIYIVPHGVDLDFYAPCNESQSLPGGRKFNFLTVSSQVERKNIKHIVRAFLEEFREHEDVALFLLIRPEFFTTAQNVALDIAGWENRYAKQSAPLFISTEYISRSNLRDFYTRADAYVLPSNEGFGLTHLEAMACGTPVIGLNYSGVVDFLNDQHGYLVSTGASYVSKHPDSPAYAGDRFYAPNVKHLRAILRHVFENKSEAREKGMRGREYCEKHHLLKRVGLKIADCLEKTRALEYTAQKKNLIDKQKLNLRNSLSWILCVQDDESPKKSLKYIKKVKSPGEEVLCLFTRYVNMNDVLKARKAGFLFYRWDGSFENCKIVARSTLAAEWAIVLNPGETIKGKLESLRSFLGEQPKDVTEVSVPLVAGKYQVRIIRPDPLLGKTRCATYDAFSIYL
ncbi:MAG: glycosyltransferase family 4 protein [Candidatus Aminicenantes bacterium]|nr:MAG: glycosyltransferase family 4 protein [Candidatus Aminicenantes bacterium]